MNRILLALLALLTGLTAQSAPVAARVCEVSRAQVGALDTPFAVVRSAAQGQQIGGPRARREMVAVEGGCRKPPRQTIFLPTVQLGPDRARE